MKLLLDTNAALWMLDRPERLSKAAAVAIDDPDNALIVSSVSIAEIAIKTSVGKLRIDYDLIATLAELGCEFLSVSVQHAWKVAELPLIHRDPFDRLIVAQAFVEGLTLITSDRTLPLYGVANIQT